MAANTSPRTEVRLASVIGFPPGGGAVREEGVLPGDGWGAYPAREASPARGALVPGGGQGGSLALPGVGTQQLLLLLEALAAGRAGEGLLSGVGPGVRRHVASLEGGRQAQLLTGVLCVRHYYRMFLPPQR